MRVLMLLDTYIGAHDGLCSVLSVFPVLTLAGSLHSLTL